MRRISQQYSLLGFGEVRLTIGLGHNQLRSAISIAVWSALLKVLLTFVVTKSNLRAAYIHFRGMCNLSLLKKAFSEPFGLLTYVDCISDYFRTVNFEQMCRREECAALGIRGFERGLFREAEGDVC